MLKILLAGAIGLATAAGIAVVGYEAGYFDSFKKPSAAPEIAATPQDGSPSEAPAAGPQVDTADKDGSEKVPTFDIVRVEPTGDAVVAGLAEPDATVALLANGKVVGKTRSNGSGEWAIVLENPLSPGDYDVAIHAEKKDGKTTESNQRVTVSIPKDKSEGDVLVVMNAEGEPSTILQKPGKQTPAPTVVAAAEPAVAQQPAPAPTNETAESGAAETGPDTEQPSAEADGSEPQVAANATVDGGSDASADAADDPIDPQESSEITVAEAQLPPSPAPTAAQQTAATASETAGPDAAADPTAMPAETADATAPAEVAEAPATAKAAGDRGDDSAAAGTPADAQPAEADAERDVAAEPAPEASSSAEPVETADAQGEPGAVSPATEESDPAAAPAPQPDASGSTVVADGSDEEEAAAPMISAAPQPTDPTAAASDAQVVAAVPQESSDPGTPSAAARDSQETEAASGDAGSAPADANVPGDAEANVTASEQGDAGASEPAPTGEVEIAAVAPDEAPAPAPAQPETPAEPAAVVGVDAVESEKGQLFVAGRATPGARVRIYVGDEYVGEATANQGGRWLLETTRDLKPGQHDVRADVIRDEAGTVLARAEVTFERESDAIILTQVTAEGSAAGGEAASGSATATVPNVIIRKGDNLWRISRRLYGEGIRYTTIYQANKGQIRNPDLIYPGQVFLTPVGDEAWTAEPGETATN